MKQMWFKLVMIAAAVFTLGFSAHQAQAQTIRYEVKVKGYTNAGWIEVRDGQNVGGEVIKDDSGVWTDRVARGETLRVKITDSSVPKCKAQDTIVGVVAANGFVRGKIVNLPYTKQFTVSRNASFDNVTVVVLPLPTGSLEDAGPAVTRRVPIGIRSSKK